MFLRSAVLIAVTFSLSMPSVCMPSTQALCGPGHAQSATVTHCHCGNACQCQNCPCVQPSERQSGKIAVVSTSDTKTAKARPSGHDSPCLELPGLQAINSRTASYCGTLHSATLISQ